MKAIFAMKAIAVSLMTFGANAYALPVGGIVAAGGASVASSAGSMTVTQSSQNVAINWQSFNIGQSEAVRFVQPNSSSVALNRVLGSDPSSILGSLSANGKVFLVNPNGILFGRGAQVSVGGLVASTLNISDNEFMAGTYKFGGAGNGSIVNQGSINAAGGYVALLGANVSNDGVILARLGTVALAAGNAITLDVAGDGLLNVTVNQGAVNALIQNGGLIQADGGQVLLTALAAGGLLQSAVNNSGVIQAQTIENRNGTIKLMGDMNIGTVNVGGTIDASAPNGGNGGFIETSAAHIKVADGAVINARSVQGSPGTWLIDPFDFTIAAVGGDITPAALAVALAANVTISSNSGGGGVSGDINVNNDVTWGAATTLTLNAVRNVNLNANITANTGSLVLIAGGDVIANAMAGTGITTTDGNMTWTAGGAIRVNAGVVGGITATRGNITWTSGGDAILDSALTTTDGNFTVCCGRDININAAVTTTDGNVSLVAGRDISITSNMTMTRGNVLLRAGPDTTGVGGILGGTVVFGPGVLYTVTAPGTAIAIDYTPNSYADPLTDYSGHFIGDASAFLTTHMLVFAKGNDKVYDGTTAATLSFVGNPTQGGVVTLVPGTATFDDKNVAPNIGITYNGYSLGGADAAKFALWTSCVAGPARTFAAINPAAVTVKANDATKAYGQTFTPAGTAFTVLVAPQNGETITGTTESSPGGTPPTAAVAGPYAITPSNATGAGFTPSNYIITYVDGALTVTPIPLTVTAGNVTKAFGETPILSAFTTTALVNGETVASVTETSPGTVATAPAAGSPYAITPSNATGAGFTPGNYTITYVDGVMTVTPLAATVPVVPPVAPPVAPPVVLDVVLDAAPPVVLDVVPPVLLDIAPPVLPPGTPPTTVAPWIPVVVLAPTPPQLLAFAPPETPPVLMAVVPDPLPVIVPAETAPKLYVAPYLQRKQDRN